MLSHEKNIALHMCAIRKVGFYIDVLSIMTQVVADLTDESKVMVGAFSVYIYC